MISKTDPKIYIALRQKIAFGAGNLPTSYVRGPGVFMFFPVVGFGMSPYKAGILAAILPFIDAILDPIMGYISDNTRSRWGRRKPIFSAGHCHRAFAFILMWQ